MDEEKIASYARDLCQQLGVPELNPLRVSWSPLNRILVSYGIVRLPKRMMGRLTPDEWKPLIASSLIYGGLVAWVAFELPMVKRFLFLNAKILQFRADKEATGIVGTEAFLQVLEKIEEMGLDKVRIQRLLGNETNVYQRIEKLRNR